MTDSEKLDLLLSKFDNLENRFDNLENKVNTIQDDVSGLKQDVSVLKDDVSGLQDDVSVLKRSAVLLETDIAPKVQILLENHSDLAKNVMVAKDIDERVGVLEFDVKVIKGILKSKAI